VLAGADSQAVLFSMNSVSALNASFSSPDHILQRSIPLMSASISFDCFDM
jgi:hypothetical protein